MLRMRVTKGSQVAIASTQTAQNQMPAPASQNSTNINAFTPRKRAILSAPLETKLSCDSLIFSVTAFEQRQEQRQPLLDEMSVR